MSNSEKNAYMYDLRIHDSYCVKIRISNRFLALLFFTFMYLNKGLRLRIFYYLEINQIEISLKNKFKNKNNLRCCFFFYFDEQKISSMLFHSKFISAKNIVICEI